jgi:hypothetical protein
MKKLLVLVLLFIGIQIASYSQGKCEVLWNNAWYPAIILESTETSWKVHYDGYGAEWDEWVGKDRIKFVWKKGDTVKVLWNTQWYKAFIIDISKDQYLVHYDGYGSEWDEWIKTDRMKN